MARSVTQGTRGAVGDDERPFERGRGDAVRGHVLLEHADEVALAHTR